MFLLILYQNSPSAFPLSAFVPFEFGAILPFFSSAQPPRSLSSNSRCKSIKHAQTGLGGQINKITRLTNHLRFETYFTLCFSADLSIPPTVQRWKKSLLKMHPPTVVTPTATAEQVRLFEHSIWAQSVPVSSSIDCIYSMVRPSQLLLLLP